MPISGKYLFVVSMDVTADKDALFNEVYDTEHIPLLLKVPGVISASRATAEPFTVMLGGEPVEKTPAGPRYHAMYEIESPDVLMSEAWAEAVEQGRWPNDVRPHTSNRQHQLLKLR